MKVIFRFLIPYLVSVIVAILAILAVAVVHGDSILPIPLGPMDKYTLLVFGLIGTSIVACSLAPAILATTLERKYKGPKPILRFALWGFVTGFLAAVYLFTGMDLSDKWVWRAMLNDSGIIISFGISGFLAGAVFGFIRQRMSSISQRPQ